MKLVDDVFDGDIGQSRGRERAGNKAAHCTAGRSSLAGYEAPWKVQGGLIGRGGIGRGPYRRGPSILSSMVLRKTIVGADAGHGVIFCFRRNEATTGVNERCRLPRNGSDDPAARQG